MTTIATICARGGSKGVPGKNLRMIAGKPLIAHTIAQALASPAVDRVFVSTDSDEIADAARRHGAEVPVPRPPELATDTAAKHPAILHMVEQVEGTGVEISRVVDLDPTSPLRTTDDIERCLELLTDGMDVVITGCPAEKSPYFNMVEALDGGGYDLVKKPPVQFERRQDAPPVFSMNASIYVWWRRTLHCGLFGPRTALYVMPRERSVDIDTPIDFQFVAWMMEGNQRDDG